MDMPQPVLAILPGVPGWAEILVILALGVLVFGKRLPDVGRNVGRGIVEFKKGLKGIEHDVDEAVNRPGEPPSIGHEPDVKAPPSPNASSDVSQSSGDERR